MILKTIVQLEQALTPNVPTRNNGGVRKIMFLECGMRRVCEFSDKCEKYIKVLGECIQNNLISRYDAIFSVRRFVLKEDGILVVDEERSSGGML